MVFFEKNRKKLWYWGCSIDADYAALNYGDYWSKTSTLAGVAFTFGKERYAPLSKHLDREIKSYIRNDHPSHL